MNLIIKESASEIANKFEKDIFQTTIRETAVGLHKRYKSTTHTRETRLAVDEYVVFLAKNLDGPTFTRFNKYLTELRNDVLNNQ